MKIKELKEKTIKDLKKMAFEKKLEMGKAKMKSDKNLKVSKNLRRDIARILTLVKEKEIIEKLKI